ncbi:MAG TPA: protein kinase [Blastococcus sp.]|nr:protein kinase [Blastococcus sp.]
MVEPGRRCLGDRYELQQLIAAGGMGQVWRGTDVALHRPVAIKVLRSEYTGDPSFLARFRAEAQHAASLSHPNIAAVFDYGEEVAQDGTGETMAYLVMELVEGEPLSALVAREGPLDTATTLSLLRQTAFGLGEAHRAGLVHRDVKPGNILVRPDGAVKITDFGIAWSARSVALTRTGQVIGTPQYLSPEQAEGRLASPASDVYALGLIGYECLTGHPAFEGDNAVTIALKQVQQDPEPLPGELPPDVRQLVGRALVKDPAGRFADGAAFAAAIDDIEEGRPLAAAPVTVAVAAAPPAAVRAPSPRRRSRAAMVLLPVLGLLAGAGIAVALLLALSNHTGPGSPAVAAETHGTGSLVLDAQDYVGRPVDDVAARLTGLGLQVQLKSEVRSDVVPGQVTAIDPAGKPLKSGDVVTVTYAVRNAADGARRDHAAAVTGAAVGVATSSGAADPTASDAQAADPSAGGNGKGGGAVTSTLPASPSPSEPSAPSSTDSSTTASAPTTSDSAPPTSASPPAAG